jgi:ribonuclease R
MGKKKGGKRLTKAELTQRLEAFFQSQPGKTFSLKEIFRQLHLDTHPLKMLAMDIMEEMTWDDFLVRVTDSSFRLTDITQVMEGTFIAKPNGKNSFLADGAERPIFVAERNSMSALDGDRVKVQMMARRRNHIREAQVIEIIKRKKDQFVGQLRVDEDFAFLVPQEPLAQNIIIPMHKLKGGKTNDRAVVKVTAWPDGERKNIVAEVIDILGEKGENNAEMNTILAQYGLPYKYPKEVEDAANKISDKITEEDYAEREDFRNVFTCTIDPHDAKDFDDALSLRKLDNGLWEVGVHIADVSHYVTKDSIIDKEAQKRATSIYLVDRTIPMLPERLCNYICSLRPDEEKLAYSVIVEMDNDANVKKHRIVHTVIKSNRRYAYEEVQELLEKNGVVDGTGQPSPLLEEGKTPEGENATELLTLDMLAKKLRAQRFKGGSIRFDREEMRFDIDETGKPIRCYFKRSKDANKLIEEFMLLANRIVAESVGKVKKGVQAKTLPYRIHEEPDPQKLETLRSFVTKFGYKLKSTGTKGATARALNQLMDECTGKTEGNAIQLVALKAMQKARYSTHNMGHFGLAFDYYTHFTSPIRRYPDTMVHRLLTKYQEGGKSANKNYYEEMCEHASQMELVAANAERDSIKYKMVEYMGQFIGETFDAHISGITSYGIYAEIDENHCEGMVPMRELNDDYYEFDEKNFCLIGRRWHNKYQLGDPIRIVVQRANLDKRQLDFTIA